MKPNNYGIVVSSIDLLQQICAQNPSILEEYSRVLLREDALELPSLLEKQKVLKEHTIE